MNNFHLLDNSLLIRRLHGSVDVLAEPYGSGNIPYLKRGDFEEIPYTRGYNGKSFQLCPTNVSVSGIQNPFQHVAVHPSKRKHHFTIQPTDVRGVRQNSSKTWQEEAQHLQKVLENDTDFQFLRPAGLRISIPGDSEGITVFDFKIKLNEEFQSNDDGNYLSNITSERVGHWRYYYPHLELKDGDKVYYWIRLIFGTGKWDVIVRGMLEYQNITYDCHPFPFPDQPYAPKPFLHIRGFKSNQASVTPPTLVGVLSGGTVGGAFRWNHQFTINATSDGKVHVIFHYVKLQNAKLQDSVLQAQFTTDSAEKWLDDAKHLKSMLLQDIDIQFLEPVGLKISISDTNDLYDEKTFYIELNGKQHYYNAKLQERSKSITRIYKDLRFKVGDRVDYYMGVSLRHHDVRGRLDISGL